MKKIITCLLLAALSQPALSSQPDARDIIKSAIDNFRGVTSYSEGSMTIHRPDWERTVSMKVWTEGMDNSLVRITAPKKDSGSGTLLIDNKMWSYAPKINRVIKIPASMSNQSWMGSDFSNNDIARADDIIKTYTHTLLKTEKTPDGTIYHIKSVPHEDAPVVWGKELLTIDQYHVLIKHEFYDQDNRLVKTLTTSDIRIIDGRHVAFKERMQKADVENEWTEFDLTNVKFDIKLDKNTFTLLNLRNP